MPGTDEKVVPEDKGLLSPLADPLGKGLGAVLTPVGAVVGGVTSPIADGASKVTSTGKSAVEKAAGGNKEEEAIGGKTQTGQNPLGL